MTKVLHCLALSLAGVCAVASAVDRPRLSITAESSPPSAMLVDGKPSGFATDKIRLMLERSGIDSEIDILPWKRAYLLAQSQPMTCVYSTTRVPERETLFKWIGPTHENDWTLFARADRKYKLRNIEEARKLRIGAYNGDVRGEYLKDKGFIVDTVQDKLSNPRKLLLDRIDLWASSLRVGSAMVAQNGWNGQIVPVLTFRRTEFYLACSKDVPDALVERMNAALVAMNKEGVSTAIERKYDFASAIAGQVRSAPCADPSCMAKATPRDAQRR
jgi:polar amino acid transport system substrate-binding protein